MNVAISDLFRVLLPRNHPDGRLAMLAAYFDDSGTHTGGKWGPSKVVVVAGIFGTEWQLDSLDRAWRRHLDRPLCGRKERLSRFHMVDCQASQGEFTGWTRTETDYFCHQLATAIIESHIGGYGIAIARKDWDSLIKGDLRRVMGDAEGYAISQCFVRGLRWARDETFDPQMTFVFDKRIPEIERRGRTVGDAFQKQSKNPAIVGTAFLSSQAITPLQAADMIAWEVYHHALDILKDGVLKPPRRAAFQRLGKEMRLLTQIAQRRSIAMIANFIRSRDPRILKVAGDYFTNFDPDDPDYSFLSGKPPSETPDQPTPRIGRPGRRGRHQ
jgi:hypothetical protein